MGSPDDLWFVRRFHPRATGVLEQVPAGAFVGPLDQESHVTFSNEASTALLNSLDTELRAHRLGRAVADGARRVRLEIVDFQWSQLARELATYVLRRESAPRDTTVDETINGVTYRHHVYLPARLQAAPPRYMLGLDYLGGSRAKQREGNVFVYRLGPERYCFGRVIRVGINVLSSSRGMLLYFYRAAGSDPDKIPPLRQSELAVAPVITDNFMWKEGAFQTVDSRPLGPSDILDRHCFESRVLGAVWYQNEHGERVARTEPCGLAGPINVLLLDVSLCNAWGEPGRPFLEESST